jgi:hypothetical protein
MKRLFYCKAIARRCRTLEVLRLANLSNETKRSRVR